MAEFGFFGVAVVTLTQTPRLNELPFGSIVYLRCRESNVYCIAGALVFEILLLRPFRISCWVVGIMKEKRGECNKPAFERQ